MVNSRLADRVQVAANGSFRRGPGLAQIVNVVDLTPLGCRLLDIPRNLSRGETISFRIGNFGPIAAHVRWLKLGREAGLEFAIPLPDAVFAILAGQDAVDPDHPYRAEIMALRNDFADVAPTGDASVPTDEDPARIHVDYEPEPVDIPQHAAAANDDPIITDQRATTRVAADDPAMCIDATRDAVAVRVIDFSREGMRLGHTGIDVAPGSRLSLVFPDNQIVDGEVRWNDGESMGLRVIYTQEEAPTEASERPIEVIAPIIEDHGEADIAVEPANSFPELPIGHLQRFAQLLAAARACDFAVVHVRIDGDGISMELSAGPAN